MLPNWASGKSPRRRCPETFDDKGIKSVKCPHNAVCHLAVFRSQRISIGKMGEIILQCRFVLCMASPAISTACDAQAKAVAKRP